MSTTLTHPGLPAGVTRFDLLSLFEQVARPGFGLSSTAVALVRHYVLKTMDADYRKGRICAVWTQACRFAEALGITPRSINSAERELERAGFIIRNAGSNGARAGDRQDGVIIWAAGINLAPLVTRYGELRGKAEALDLQARAISQCRAEIRQLGQRIRHACDDILRQRAEAILPGGRTARITSIARLTAIRETLSAMLDAIASAPASDPRAPKTSDAPEENCAPNIQDKNSPRSCSARGAAHDRITPTAAVSVATQTYQGLVAGLGGATWPNIVEASWRSCARLGIAQSTWGRACHHFGRERAALCVLLIDRNAELPGDHRYKARSPSRCLSGMMRKDRNQGFNLTGLFRAGQSDQVMADLKGRPSPPESFQTTIEEMGNGTLGLFASSLLACLGTQFEGGAAQ